MSSITENGVRPLGSVEPILGAADLTGKENHLASFGSSGLSLTSSVNEQVNFLLVNGGTTTNSCDARPWVPGGVYKVWVSAAVVKGAKLQLASATPGQLITQTTGHCVAEALEATSGAGICLVQAQSTNVQAKGQPAPVAYNTTATLTAADLIDGILTSSTAAAVTATTPTGTQLTAAAPHVAIGGAFDFAVINTGGSNAFTLQAGTDVTVTGSAVAASSSGLFRAKRTAANTWVIYRIA